MLRNETVEVYVGLPIVVRSVVGAVGSDGPVMFDGMPMSAAPCFVAGQMVGLTGG